MCPAVLPHTVRSRIIIEQNTEPAVGCEWVKTPGATEAGFFCGVEQASNEFSQTLV